MLEFRLLGAVEAGDGDGTVALGSRKQRALLAYLVLHRNRAIARESLIDVLWPDDPPATASHALDVYVSRLRKVLAVDGLLQARGGAIELKLADEAVDVARFERLLAAARRADDPRERLVMLDQALALWRGHALADLLDEEFARVESERLEDERLAAVEQRLETTLELGRHDEAIGPLQALVGQQPLRERPRRLLMLALYRGGRQSDALDVFRDMRRLLRDELGLEPSRELRDLEAAILRHDPALAASVRAAGDARAEAATRRRRSLLVVAAVAIAVAGAALAVLLLTGGNPGEAVISVPDLAAVALDPHSGHSLPS